MTHSTAVNPQITDAITQANTKVVGEASGVLMPGFNMIEIMNLQAATGGQNTGTPHGPSSAVGVAMLHQIDTTSGAVGIAGDLPEAVRKALGLGEEG